MHHTPVPAGHKEPWESIQAGGRTSRPTQPNYGPAMTQCLETTCWARAWATGFINRNAEPHGGPQTLTFLPSLQ